MITSNDVFDKAYDMIEMRDNIIKRQRALLDRCETALADIDCWHKEHEADALVWREKDEVECYVTIGELRHIHEVLAAIRSEGQ